MYQWKSVNITFLYDGSFFGLLTIVFDCYVQKTIPLKIIPENEYETNLLDHIQCIQTDEEKANRIFHGVIQKSYDILFFAYHAFLNHKKEKELPILKYLLDAFLIGQDILTMFSVPHIFFVHNLERNTLFEAHRLKGLVRFIDAGNNLFYASIHPDNNVVEIVGKHFIKRLPTQNFILHDKNRNIAFVYNCKDSSIVEFPDNLTITISKNEKSYQELWKLFYNTISIKERKNDRLRMQFMPKKYWKDLIENPYYE